MEPIEGTIKIYLGEFVVVDCKLDGITLNIGRNVHITIHVGDLPHKVKIGDKLPLFTEISYAYPRSTPVQ